MNTQTRVRSTATGRRTSLGRRLLGLLFGLHLIAAAACSDQAVNANNTPPTATIDQPTAGTEVVRAIKERHVICLISDRDILGGGIEVEFFGERTTMPGGPATLALRTGAPLLPGAPTVKELQVGALCARTLRRTLGRASNGEGRLRNRDRSPNRG